MLDEVLLVVGSFLKQIEIERERGSTKIQRRGDGYGYSLRRKAEENRTQELTKGFIVSKGRYDSLSLPSDMYGVCSTCCVKDQRCLLGVKLDIVPSSIV